MFSDVSSIRTDTLIKVLHWSLICREDQWILLKQYERFFSRPSASPTNLKGPREPRELPKICGRFSGPANMAAMAAMPSQLKVTTVEGGVLTLEVMPANTIAELKAMLHEKKHCQDPIEHQILKVSPGRWIVSRWWSDTGVCGAVACGFWSDCNFLQKRSWSCNKGSNPCRGPPSSQHPILPHRDIWGSL